VTRVTPPPIASVFVVDRPNIPPGDVDLTVRGAATTPVSIEEQIGSALDKADKGDLAAASSDLQAVAKKNPASRIAALALGAVQLRASQNAEAIGTLERARTLRGDAATADEAGWFLGIALVRTAQPDRARAVLEEVCRHAGPRSATACAGVAEIDRSKSPK
jgi:predicted Zn-dependent protease